MKTKIVISTIINGRKNFVYEHTRPCSTAPGKRLVDYTNDETRAMQFKSAGEAEAFIQEIVNPFERQLKADEIETSETKVPAAASFSREKKFL